MSATNTANATATPRKKVEKWEIEKIGCFLLELYHQNVFSSQGNWLVLKWRLREKFCRFLSKPENVNAREKFDEKGMNNIGSLLQRTNFIIHTPPGSDHYRIKNMSLFHFRNQKIQELDNQCKNGEQQKQGIRGMESVVAATATENNGDGLEDVDPALAVLFQVDANSETHSLEYQATERQARNPDFLLTSMGCYICQINFETADAFETHVEYHGDDSDFESLEVLTKSDSSMFKLSYMLCKNSHYFCFTLETAAADIVIDKIIIVQSRDMYYVHNTRVPYELPASGRQNFFVDSHLFRIYVQQPIVVVCHERGSEQTRIMEQHHFMRVEEFPMVQFGINPCRLPSKKLFKTKFKLPQYLPTNEMRLALRQEFPAAHLTKICNDFDDYMRKGKVFTLQNLGQAMNVLLQVEDMDGISEYASLVQRNAILRKYENEYSLKLEYKNDKRIFIENVLSLYDEVLVIPENEVSDRLKADVTMDLMLKNSDDFGKPDKKKKIYFGQVERISNGRVTFVCDKPIRIEQKYLVIFRPARLVLRYQYRALELFDQMAGTDKKRFLFPEAVLPRDLPTNSLELHNASILTNPEQLEAVRNIAEGPRTEATYIIFGPPGTGKTTTLVEAIYQLYLRRSKTKILITAGSNSACDEIALRLCKVLNRFDDSRAIVRIYARSNERRSDNIDEHLLEASNMYSAQFYPDIELLHQYRIVVCTLSVIGKLATGKLGKDEEGNGIYTHVFVDEVAASTEAEVLVGIMGILTPQSSLILAGDHKQLGPILQSARAEDLGLAVSLMERLLKRECYRIDEEGSYDHTIQTRLCRNYRSHREIVKLYSEMYYDGELRALARNDITNLSQKWHRSPNPNYPIIFHSVFGKSEREKHSLSLHNPKELEVVMDYVKDLMFYGVNGEKIAQTDIGIISPYKKQYLRIQDELNLRHWYQIETGSVETFQGKEKPIIIVSFVRSFTSTLGFLDNPRRLNVTLSRPKSLLILIGNPKTLCLNEDFKHIIQKCSDNKTLVGTTFYDRIESMGTPSEPTTTTTTEKVESLTKSVEKLNLGENDGKADQTQNMQKTKIFEKTPKNCPKKNKKKVSANVGAAVPYTKINSSKGASNTKINGNNDTAKDVRTTLQLNQLDALFNELPNVPLQKHKPLDVPIFKNLKTEAEIMETRKNLLEQIRKFEMDWQELQTSPSLSLDTTKLTLTAAATIANAPEKPQKDSNLPHFVGQNVVFIPESCYGEPQPAVNAAKAEHQKQPDAPQNTKLYLKRQKGENLAHLVGQNVVLIPESCYREPQPGFNAVKAEQHKQPEEFNTTKSTEAKVQSIYELLKTQKEQYLLQAQQKEKGKKQRELHKLSSAVDTSKTATTAAKTEPNTSQNIKTTQATAAATANSPQSASVNFVGQNLYTHSSILQASQPGVGNYLKQQQQADINKIHAPQQHMNSPQYGKHLPPPQYNMVPPQRNMFFIPAQNHYSPHQNVYSPQQQHQNYPQQNMHILSLQQNMHMISQQQNMHILQQNMFTPPRGINPPQHSANLPPREQSQATQQSGKIPPLQETKNTPLQSKQHDAATVATQHTKINSSIESEKSLNAPASVHLKWQRDDYSPPKTATIPHESNKPPPYSTLNLKWQRDDNSSQSDAASTTQSESTSPPITPAKSQAPATKKLNSSSESDKLPQYPAPTSVNLKWQRSDYSPPTTATNAPPFSSANTAANANTPHEYAAVNLKWQRDDNSSQLRTISKPIIVVKTTAASSINTTNENSPQRNTSSKHTPQLQAGIHTTRSAKTSTVSSSQSSGNTSQSSGSSTQSGLNWQYEQNRCQHQREVNKARAAELERIEENRLQHQREIFIQRAAEHERRRAKSKCIIA